MSNEEFLNLPILQDDKLIAPLRILGMLCTTAGILNPIKMYEIISLKVMQLTVKFGLTLASPQTLCQPRIDPGQG